MPSLLLQSSYTDATLACDGHFYPVHKFVLSTCSQYFNAIFEWTPCINPVVVINNVTCKELEALLDFMYIGEVSVKDSLIPDVMRAAECLRIRGLSLVDDENAKSHLKSKNKSDISGPPRKRKRTTSAKKKCAMVSPDKIKTSCESFEANGHLSPPPTSVSGNQYTDDEEMKHEDPAPELTPHHLHRNPQEAESQAVDLPSTLAPSSTSASVLPAPASSSPQPHHADQPGKSVSPPKPSVNQHSHISPPQPPAQSLPCAIDLSSHEHASKITMNTAVEVIKSGKMEIRDTKPLVQHAHNVVSSEEIPDLLDSLVDMRPLYDSKPEAGEEVATLHAVVICLSILSQKLCGLCKIILIHILSKI